jgi:two-component system sensor histidine kinase/response regulator
VVEDNPINREVARGLLNKRGHLIVTVNDGQQGVEEWRKGNYDLVLMDIQMPVMDGPTATQRIRAEEKISGGHTPIIAMTAHALKGTEEECLAYGMDGYVSKPLMRDLFIKTVEGLARPAPAKSKTPVVVSIVAAPAVTASANDVAESLIHEDKMAKYVGDDPAAQQHVLDLCRKVLVEKLPKLYEALEADDLEAIQRLAHFMRGSLGLLGLPALIQLTEEIEYQHETLGETRWRQCCDQFCKLLERLNQELQQRQAA